MLVTMFIIAMLSAPFAGGMMLSSLDEMPASGAPALPTFGAGSFVFVFLVGIRLKCQSVIHEILRLRSSTSTSSHFAQDDVR